MVGLPEWPPYSLRCVALRCVAQSTISLFHDMCPGRLSARKKKLQDDTLAGTDRSMRAFHFSPTSYAKKWGQFARFVLYIS